MGDASAGAHDLGARSNGLADMDLAEEMVKYLVTEALDNQDGDLSIFEKFIDKGLRERLEAVASNPFERVSYTDAVSILQKSGKKFDYPVEYGHNLQSEHERFLTEEHVGKPVILTDYPKDIKAFYMRMNEDGKTVRAMDVLVPMVGEIIGGSQREERLDVLEARITEQGMDLENYWWYLDLRRFGTVPHAGFGLGFERLVQYCTGLTNIRDVIPFPRTPKHADF